ncbi:MAG: TrmB family transcriptional regulator [Candidatus Nanoarchaeia archaeon]
MNSNILEEIGLTANESKVYISLIELGSSSASQIIQKTGLHRAVVYDLLERLIEKGLVGHVITGRKKYFEATNPQRLKQILKEKENRLDTILPNLLELSKFKSILDVKIYKGKEGIKTVFENIIRANPKEWLTLGSGGKTYEIMPYYLEHFHKARIANKIKARGLVLNTMQAKKRAKDLSKLSLTIVKVLPKGFVTPTVINIYNENVALFSSSENNIPFVILIENKELSKSFKEHFEYLWNKSDPLS